MSVAIMSLIYKTPLGSPSLKAVALKLADCANDEGRSIYPSKQTIADQTELGLSTVKECVAELMAMGVLLCEEPSAGGHRGETTVYAFDLDALASLPRLAKRQAGRPKKTPATGRPGLKTPPAPGKTPPADEKTPPAGGPNPSENHQEEQSVVVAHARKRAKPPSADTTTKADGKKDYPRPLAEGWLMPEDWRRECELSHPEQTDRISAEAAAFLRYNLERMTVARADEWRDHWRSWWLRAVARMQRPAAKAAIKFGASVDVTVRDTSESFAAYTARMIAEGKYKPAGARA